MNENKIYFCEDLKESKIRYAGYIREHIKAVKDAYTTAEEAFKEVFPEVYSNDIDRSNLLNNINDHDRSKYNDNEFYGYAMKFYPVINTDPESESVNQNFQMSWLRHVHNNPHHPAYWLLPKSGGVVILDMPDIYIIEMLCDWMAMGKYYGGTTLSYWKSKFAKELPMSIRTISKVDKFMQWMQDHNVHTLW